MIKLVYPKFLTPVAHESESIHFAADPNLLRHVRDTTRGREGARLTSEERAGERGASKPETRMRFREIAQTSHKKRVLEGPAPSRPLSLHHGLWIESEKFYMR